MTSNPLLYCPVRGQLSAKIKAKDGLTFSEEKRRIDCINLLLSKGYPKTHIEAETLILRFGNGAKNSLRADVVVYDRSVDSLINEPIEKRRSFMKIVAEIKRNSADAQSAKEHQLKPAMELIPSTDCIGVYWDDSEQSIFFKRVTGASIDIIEASIATLPIFGTKIGTKDIFYTDLKPVTDLVSRFSRLDDILHQAALPKDDRYEVLFKVLLVKIFDEQKAKAKNDPMLLQDFSVGTMSDADVLKKFEDGLAASLMVYGPLLPRKPTKKIGCSGDTLRQISKILCPLNILGSSAQVIQDFFMYFGRFLYKVDLWQQFTTYEIIDLVVRIINPKFGDTVRDPACGTADFLVGAKRIAQERHSDDIAAHLYGVDTADLAVNLSVFNMILNGDGSSHISAGDSLRDLSIHEEKYTVALCNPPFGTRIVEKRKNVLSTFELAKTRDGKLATTCETGLLFVEVCLRSVVPGGRVGIILPNGYLGNRSPKYLDFRKWLFKQARIAAVIGFPRFTFKKSGADVSASVVILEKRDAPLETLEKMEDFPIHFNLVEKVGWDLQSKRAGRIYKRNELTGSLELGSDNEPVLDADFSRVLSDLYSTAVVDAFPWMRDGVPEAVSQGGWIKQAQDLVDRGDLCIDPKRWCPKHENVRTAIEAVDNFAISDVLAPVERRLKRKPSDKYRYVEIEKIFENFGAYISENYFGWELPDRGKQIAAPGDFFIANIWSSAGKWMRAGTEAEVGDLIVTTGCTQFKVVEGKEDLLPDLIFGLCSEAFKVQMRAMATGSDGLSSISTEDIGSIVLPIIPDAATRALMADRLKEMNTGRLVLTQVVRGSLSASLPSVDVPQRSAHVVQV
jgi:type I restriction enzyme M protein